jgi:hypothetical protein
MILLGASVVLLGVIARSIDRFAESDGETRAARATRILLWAFATVVIVQAGLGAIGLLTPIATFLVLVVVAAGAFRVAWPRRAAATPVPEAVTKTVVAASAMLLAVFVVQLWEGLHKTTFLYDTLSYHLHIPATWMHDRRVTIVPAVFGDPSPAYAPANLELWFLFLMAPLRSDYLAGVGQLPFGALAVCAIATCVRDARASRSTAVAAALAFVLIPEVFTQIPTAMTDLGFAACLLASLPFALRLWTAKVPRRADLLTAATGIGLAIGTKYVAAALALLFVTLSAGAWLRRRPADLRGAAAAVALLLATGGFWYIRNLVVTGNPIFPVAFPGLHLPALYGRAEMRAWDYHVPVGDVRALGSMLIGGGIGFWFALAVALGRHWRRPLTTLLLGLVAVFWFIVPYQESRFLFAIFGVAAVLIGQAARGSRHVGGALAVALAAAFIEWPTAIRLMLLAAPLMTIVVLTDRPALLARLDSRRAARAGAAGAALLFVALAFEAADYATVDPRYSVGDEIAADWAWFRANVREARVAYTGTNVAFPLAGERLTNDVRYVNVAGAPGDRLHDFGPPGDGTAEPAPYRRGASAGVWLANLRAARTEVLFVAAMVPGVRRNIEADSGGFPAERAWADARPDVFYLLHASENARIYSVTPR